MKTKVNEIPLVGPRGRKELFEKVHKLEEKIATLESTIKPIQYTETSLSFDVFAEELSISENIGNIRINGNPLETVEQLRSFLENIKMTNTIVRFDEYADYSFDISFMRRESNRSYYDIQGGSVVDISGTTAGFHIYFDFGNDSFSMCVSEILGNSEEEETKKLDEPELEPKTAPTNKEE